MILMSDLQAIGLVALLFGVPLASAILAACRPGPMPRGRRFDIEYPTLDTKHSRHDRRRALSRR